MSLFYRYLLNKSYFRCSSCISEITVRNFSKDLDVVKATVGQDLLLTKLKSAVRTNNVLELVSDHHKIMNNKHMIQALRSIFMSQKSGQSNFSSNDLLQNTSFKKLCLLLKSQARLIDTHDTIEALKIISYVGIPADSTITQVLLQIIRHNVNQLTLQQIIFLEYIMKQYKSTPLSDALLIALPIVFEINMPLKMDKENINQLADILQYISRKHISQDNLELLLSSIYSHRYIDAKIAIGIVWSLCDIKPQPSLEPLLQKALNIVTAHAHSINFPDLETTLSKTAHRTNIYQPYYYNPTFFDTVADITIDENLGFQQALWVQQKLNKVGHFHKGLLDYIAQFCYKDDDIFTSTSQQNLYILITAFTNSEYKSDINWENVVNKIENNRKLYTSDYNFDWVKFAARLAVLDIFVPQVLQNTFTENYIKKLMLSGNSEDCRHFLILCETLNLKKELKNYISFNDVKKVLSRYKLMNHQDYPLQGAMEKAFGGKQYILSQCTSKFGIDIHHAIIMRKGGYPVSLSNLEINTNLLIEDIECPADSKIIAVLSLNSTSFCQNTYQLRGINTLVIKILENSGYTVVPISNDHWMELADYEKIPYLMRNIKEKSDNLEELNVEL